ncbi:MAG TPA: hypothetical protein VER96_24455 [Polyangiaceae bacterium]|nr:hypothetical protein [Polyangiaceae bacterium]
MARRRPVAPASLPLFESAPVTGIRLHAAGERLSTLLKQRERLLAEVKRKQVELEAASVRASAAAQEAAGKMAPIIGRFEELRAEIGALFDELLAPKRLAARARKKVAEVHRSLVAQGLIPPREASPTDGSEESELDDGAVFDDFDADGPPFSESRRHEARVASAPQHGQTPGRDSLRSLFKRLALAVHPDRARHDDDRERRTEAMKEATRAYEDGDLARLLELEKAWQSNTEAPKSADEDARRCVELEQTLRELSRQSRALTAELRDLRRQVREDMLDVPMDQVIADAQVELKDVERIRDFTRDFRDGKISLTTFLGGPESEQDPLVELEEILGEMLRAQSTPAPGGSKKRRRKR